MPRSSLAEIGERADGVDAIALLEAQGASRLESLLPLRYERMLESPFGFLRGAATVHAHDLANAPTTGIETQICGDAHLMNFGVFSSPERRFVFDVNDFDETTTGPFEWDLKRLVTSFAVASTTIALSATDRDRVVRSATRSYRTAMAHFAREGFLSLWYESPDLDQLEAELGPHFGDEARRRVGEMVSRARRKTDARAFEELVEVRDGRPRIRHSPPLLVPLADVATSDELATMPQQLAAIVDGYATTLTNEREELVRRFTPIDAAQKVVGVGSVGTRCWIILLLGRDVSDPLFLQVKEAVDSVVDLARRKHSDCPGGPRVVRGQRIMQVDPDPFLGWHDIVGLDGVPRSYYVRQLYDNKGSVIIDRMDRRSLSAYARLCAISLARAHARGGAAAHIDAYLGRSEVVDEALLEYAVRYERRNEEDYRALQQAARDGRIKAATS